MVIALTQDLRKSAVITSRDKSSVEERNKTDMRLKKILYSFLKEKVIRIRDSGMSDNKDFVLNNLIRHKPTINLEGRVFTS